MKTRLILLTLFFGGLWSLILLRSAQLQLLPAEQLQLRQEKQFQTVLRLEARRGALVDRKGRELAISVKAFSLFADPSKVQSPKAVAEVLSKILKVPQKSLLPKLRERQRKFVWLARKLDAETQEAIVRLKLPGLGFVEEYKRIYPNQELLAPVLGMVGSDGQGLEGLELGLEELLQGQARKVSVPRDARGRPLIIDGMVFAEVPEGHEVQLTIDSEIQNELERELQRAQKEFDADQALGVVLDVKTGEVVALGMSPGFDANKALKVKPERRRNRAVVDVYEPGSVLKTIAIAGALQEGLITPSTRIDTEGGRMKVADRIIREADAKHNWKSLTVSEVLSLSSNVGTAKLAFMLGEERLRKYLLDFGFGQRTGIEIPGEARGVVQSLPWNSHLLANVAFGQGVSVNAIQVAAAYQAIANGGIWRQPRLIKALREPGGEEWKPAEPGPARQVLRPEVAHAMRFLLAGVTNDLGTGKSARVEGFPVGGKTGTAQKANPNARGYMDGAYISSFVGFLPVNDPRYVISVSVDHPKQSSYYGSQVAAPVFARIAGYISRLEGWAPVVVSERNMVKGRSKPRSSIPNVLIPEASEVVPDLTNLTLREVLHRFQGQELDLRVQGSGLVHRTWPATGELWPRKKRLTLFMGPERVQRVREESEVPPDPSTEGGPVVDPGAEPALLN